MGCPKLPETPEYLFRKHIAEMRDYASEIEKIIGVGPIVKRIRSCAAECEAALDRVAARRNAIERGEI